jgi:hypothetical protein
MSEAQADPTVGARERALLSAALFYADGKLSFTEVMDRFTAALAEARAEGVRAGVVAALNELQKQMTPFQGSIRLNVDEICGKAVGPGVEG